ncbi:MAG TPA: HAD family hydrolase [Gammaproteobacteria bacterium]|nr:HAD family hydrolase [Gammaproteobacteria bacterium]
MTLAIFDLDNTLLGGDSDARWGEFLVEQGLVDARSYGRENQRFYREYCDGTLDIHEFLAFALRPLAEIEPDRLLSLRERYMEEKIVPIMLPRAHELLEKHRRAGHELLIITATNRFVTAPIAQAYGVENLLATDPEMKNGRYTGRVAGTPCFQGGKVSRLKTWLRGRGANLAGSWFYSDSHNDLPLLEQVEHPVAVDPDDTLRKHAGLKGWPVISLRDDERSGHHHPARR